MTRSPPARDWVISHAWWRVNEGGDWFVSLSFPHLDRFSQKFILLLTMVRSKIRITLLLILLLSIIPLSFVTAKDDKRPFWTEKSSYIEGADLFVVGVASNEKTVEKARKIAFENGKVELMNFAQVTDLESKGLIIETQMTFEDPHDDGTVTVYRLLRVPIDRLLKIQENVKTQGESNTIALKKIQAELKDKKREMESTIEEVHQLEESLLMHTRRVEEKQKEVELLLAQINGDSSRDSHPGKSVPVQILKAQLKDAEERMDQREAEIEKLIQRIKERVRHSTKIACSLNTGMTRKDVREILGKPDGILKEAGFWYYGASRVEFDSVDVLAGVYNRDEENWCVKYK
ncbi:MAG: hypothetical protein HY204_11215 [Nitrospirae bacterium]|nr:hypothetical protein [Nitrospirota bacterium]